MIQARTYTCGDAGGVRKLVDLTGAWIDVSLPINGIPNAITSSLVDIAADPNNGDKVYVVGDFHCNTTGVQFFGIGVSSDGGVTWQIPTGSYQSLFNPETCYYKWTKVSVVDANTIYVSGIVDPITGLGVVIKSADGGASFNLCASLPAAVINQDATSIHFSTTLLGVVGLNNYILKSIDGGFTWIVMNGGTAVSTNIPAPGTALPIGQITGIHITNDESYIMAIGDGSTFILESKPVSLPTPLNTAGIAADSWQKNFYPGGAGFPGNYGYHLSYLNPALGNDNFIVISGYGQLGVHGSTPRTGWVTPPAPGYAITPPGLFTRLAAHFFNIDIFGGLNGFYLKNGFDVYYNPQGFNPPFEALSESAPYRVHSIWTWYQELPAPKCYLLTECSTFVTIVTTTDLSTSLGSVVTLSGYSGCYTVSDNGTDCVGGIAVTLTSSFQTCLECIGPAPTCYLLTDCASVFPNIVTDSDLSLYVSLTVTLSSSPGVCWQVSLAQDCTGSIALPGTIVNNYIDCVTCQKVCYALSDCDGQFNDIITDTDVSIYVGQVINLAAYPGVCWQVSTSSICTGSVPVTGITASFANCVACKVKCYKLVDCTGFNTDIITDSDLSALVGKIIKISGCPEVCWTVLNSSSCTGSISVTPTIFYSDCPSCLNVVKADVVLKNRSVYPNYGNSAGNCSVDYMEKVNCNFSENVYNKILVKRYGIKSCEEDTNDKWWVKKQLLTLDLIKDSAACVLPQVLAPCALSSDIMVFYPIECPAVTSLSSTMTVPITCDPVTDLTSTFSF